VRLDRDAGFTDAMNPSYHEREAIRLIASVPGSRGELHDFLKRRGFSREDDFYLMDRPDVAEPWQSITVMSIDVLDEGAGDADGLPWVALEVSYLMATLPASFIATCVGECESLAGRFDLRMEFGGEAVSPGQLGEVLRKIAGKLTEEFDGPGSELLAILIEQSYGR
jgi:hypothetical protein